MSEVEIGALPEWVAVGATVASLRSDWRGYQSGPVRGVITKIGKRDIVLDNGQRFNRRSLRRSEGGAWGRTYALLSEDDPAVREATVEATRRLLKAKAQRAADEWRLGKVSAFDVVLAFAPLTGVANEILALDHRANS